MPPAPVRIYEVVREWTTHAWLCESCVKARRARGWTIRSSRLPPPRQLTVTVGPEGDWCDAALDDRVPLRCQDCHLGELLACPTCGGPVIYPGAVGFDQCEDPAHPQVVHSPAQPRDATAKPKGKKSGKKKAGLPPGDAP